MPFSIKNLIWLILGLSAPLIVELILGEFSWTTIVAFAITLVPSLLIVYFYIRGYAFYNYNGKPNYWLCKVGCHPEQEYEFKENPNSVVGKVLTDDYPQGIYRYCPGCGRVARRIKPSTEIKDRWEIIDVDRWKVLAAHHVKEWLL